MINKTIEPVIIPPCLAAKRDNVIAIKQLVNAGASHILKILWAYSMKYPSHFICMSVMQRQCFNSSTHFTPVHFVTSQFTAEMYLSDSSCMHIHSKGFCLPLKKMISLPFIVWGQWFYIDCKTWVWDGNQKSLWNGYEWFFE